MPLSICRTRALSCLSHNLLALLLLAGPTVALADASTTNDNASTRANAAFDAARQQSPLALHAFLEAMPKGGDLHSHLSGAVYAETWIADAADAGLCVNNTSFGLSKPLSAGKPPHCDASSQPVADAFQNQTLYDDMINAGSMRSFVPFGSHNGHDQFFDSFQRFGLLGHAYEGQWLAKASSRAAAQNEQYLELMVTPPFVHARALAMADGWNPDFAALRKQLLKQGLTQEVGDGEKLLDQIQAQREQVQHCGKSDADAGCSVQTRFLYQVLRGFPPQQVFAQTLLGFELASKDPRWVGINFVMPEDGYLSMRDYSLQMHMLAYLHQQYPKVHITLHAGELAPGLVPPDGLRFHIREAVDVAHAERIGHGVDVMYEDHPYELLKDMAARKVMVEVNLTSNDVILGITGKQHPLPMYLRYGVPVALSTDDEGVSRIDLTHEYVRAASEFQLSYPTLKQFARNSLQYSFMPGAALWLTPTQMVDACASDMPGAAKPSKACAKWLASSEKGRLQWSLETRFHTFEATF